jgi:hypothetical protein
MSIYLSFLVDFRFFITFSYVTEADLAQWILCFFGQLNSNLKGEPKRIRDCLLKDFLQIHDIYTYR